MISKQGPLLQRQLHHFCYLLVLLCLGISQHAEARDGVRILVIDSAMFAGIANQERRRLAIDHMLQDIQSIETDENAPGKMQTFVYTVSNGLLRKMPGYRPTNENIRLKIERLPEIKMLYSRNSPTAPQGFDPEHLAKTIHDVINQTRMKRGNVDVHIFAQTWKLGFGRHSEALLGDNMPASCVQSGLNLIRTLPKNIVLGVEIRPIDGASRPSRGRISALLTVLGNTSVGNDNVLFLGVKGPTCATQQRSPKISPSYGHFIPWSDPNIPPNCSDIQETAISMSRVSTCINLPSVVAQGRVDRRPNHLVARDNMFSASKVSFLVTQGPKQSSLRAQTGVIVLGGNMKRSVSRSTSGTYEATLNVIPLHSCKRGVGQKILSEVELKNSPTQVGRISIATGPFDCQPFDLKLGSIVLK